MSTATPPPGGGHLVSGSTYLSLPRAPETWLIKDLLPVGGSMLIFGDAKAGKSYLGLQLALALSGARPDFLSFQTIRTGRVAYIQLDTPRSLWADRISRLTEAGEPFPSAPIWFGDRETLGTWPFDITDPSHRSILRKGLWEEPVREEVDRETGEVLGTPVAPTAVILDTIREAHSLDENDSTDMRNVIAAVEATVRPAALIIIAHARKPSGDAPPDLMADNRGSNFVVGRMDAILRLTKKTIYYTGRAIEEGSFRIRRTDSGLWVADEAGNEDHLRAVLADPTLSSLSARAKALAGRIGKGEEACRSILRRVAGDPPPTPSASRLPVQAARMPQDGR